MLDKSFVGKEISVFMEGGWSVSGKILSVNGEDHFFIKNKDGLGVVFYSKICTMMISEKKAKSPTPSTSGKKISMPEEKPPKPLNVDDEEYSNHPLHSQTSGYNNMPFGPSGAKSEDEFSVFFGAAKTEKINFRVSEEGEKNEES
ncbi:hypothetical protein N9W84_00565 [bacterium]|nr:hypothetical protein [bacterium]